jgi:hypothetical protein
MADSAPYASLDAKVRQGLAWLQDHRLNHAETAFREALAADPTHALAQRMLGVTLCQLGGYDEGVAALTLGVQADPSNARAWADLAVALRDAGRAREAVEAYAHAAAAQPEGSPVPHLAGQIYSTERGSHDFTIAGAPYRAEIRHGAGRPPHLDLATLIGEGRDRYRDVLTVLGAMQADFAQMPLAADEASTSPCWLDPDFPPLDAMALTGMLRAHDPARMIEIGSGAPTRFARRAIETYGLRTKLASIDAEAPADIDGICDRVIRRPLERCGLAMFEELEAGDVFFLDSSHRAFQGSDVTVFFLEILPRLKAGVIVHIHDIYLPDDYISGCLPRLWNEQYLLATALLFGADRFEILFPSWFVGRDHDLAAYAKAMLRKGPLADLDLHGASFWMRVV